MTVRYFERSGRLFRKDGYAEERFDSDIDTWSNVYPAISDWLFHLDTMVDEISETTAKSKFAAAFVEVHRVE